MIKIDIDKAALNSLLRDFNLEEKKIEKARNWALRDAGRWFKSQCATRISKATNIQKKVVNQRIKEYMYDGAVKIFSGLRRINLMRLTARQDRMGVKAGIKGTIRREGAFIAPAVSGKNDKFVVYKRIEGVRHYPPIGRYARKNIQRELLEVQKVDFDQVAQAIINDVADNQLYQRFLEDFKKALTRLSK